MFFFKFEDISFSKNFGFCFRLKIPKMQKRNFSESKNCAKNEEESFGEREVGHNLEIRKQGGGGKGYLQILLQK